MVRSGTSAAGGFSLNFARGRDLDFLYTESSIVVGIDGSI